MLLVAGLALLGGAVIVLALRPGRSELRLPREDEVSLSDVRPAEQEAPHTIDLTAREIDPDRPRP